jgi:hemin uptake protein HemP
MNTSAVTATRLGIDQALPGFRVLDARDLLAGAREVLIRHQDQVYRLRLTAAGKLLLMK